MDKPELKPCPFCGGEALTIYWDGSKTYSVGCVNTFVCHGGTHTSKIYRTEQEAAEAWNRRAEQTGEWLEDEYGYCRCSLCGYEHDDPETTTPYCPECGARMNGMTEVSYEEETT